MAIVSGSPSLIVGLGFLLLGFCILSLLVQQMWALAAIVFGVAVLAFLTVMLTEMVSLGLDVLVGKLLKFIFHNERYGRTRGVRTPRALFMPPIRIEPIVTELGMPKGSGNSHCAAIRTLFFSV